MYEVTPAEMASTIETPIMPILPATETSAVRFALESRFLRESINAIPIPIEDFFFLPLLFLPFWDCSASTAISVFGCSDCSHEFSSSPP